jgi:hypothetical protein
MNTTNHTSPSGEDAQSERNVKEIFTSKGEAILVDDEDFERVSKFSWRITNGYGCIDRRENGRKFRIYMHRLLLELKEDDGLMVDHINGIRTDNRRANLRICTQAQNQRNRGAQRNNSTGYKGVSFISRENRYHAAIKVNGKTKALGNFGTAEEAHAAYCAAALELHGEFANFGDKNEQVGR